jgi:hypothetical protein
VYQDFLLKLVFPMVAFLLGWVVGWIQGYYPEREKVQVLEQALVQGQERVRELEKALVLAKELERESAYWKPPVQP